MLHTSTKTLILKLCELTARGEIAWREGERRCSVFETEGYTVEVEAEPPTVRVLNADGRELERTGGNELTAEPWPNGDGNFGSHVAEMAERAHRVARGAERAIATILTALSAPPKAEPKPRPDAPKPEAAPAAEVVAPAVAAVAETAATTAAREAEMAQAKPPEPPPVVPVPVVQTPPAPVVQAAPPPAPPSAPVYVLDPNQRPQPKRERAIFGGIASFSQPVKREPRVREAAPAPRPAPQRFSMSAVTRQTIRGEEVRSDAPPASADAAKSR